MGGTDFEEEGGEGPKMARRLLYIAVLLGLGGFEAVSEPFDLDRAVRSGGGLGRWARLTSGL
mgnify:CR=1 FL=1